tara:strand:- start:164 stop:874 length:711 start_codon:yes stop_codon:yes gene_type:complete
MELSKYEIIIRTWNIIKEHLPLLVLTVLFMFTLNIIFSVVQDKIMMQTTYRSIIFISAAFLFQAGLNLGMIRISLNMINQKNVYFSLLFSSFHMLIPSVLASLVYICILFIAALPGLLLLIYSSGGIASINIFSILSIILLIAPATYLSVRFQFYNYFLIDEECEIIESLKKSANISHGHILELFVIGAMLSIITLISIIPLGLGLLISIPLSTTTLTYIYMILSKKIHINNRQYK